MYFCKESRDLLPRVKQFQPLQRHNFGSYGAAYAVVIGWWSLFSALKKCLEMMLSLSIFSVLFYSECLTVLNSIQKTFLWNEFGATFSASFVCVRGCWSLRCAMRHVYLRGGVMLHLESWTEVLLLRNHDCLEEILIGFRKPWLCWRCFTKTDLCLETPV